MEWTAVQNNVLQASYHRQHAAGLVRRACTLPPPAAASSVSSPPTLPDAPGPDAALDDDVPPGYTRLPPLGPFFELAGPFHAKKGEDGLLCLGLRVRQVHLNMQGVTHGGFLATVADGAFGIAVAQAKPKPGPQVTVSLNMDYLSAARLGEWLEARVKVSRVGSRMAFADGGLYAGGRQVMRASAVFSFPAHAPGSERPTGPDESAA